MPADQCPVRVAYLFLAHAFPTIHRSAWRTYLEGCPADSFSVHVHAGRPVPSVLPNTHYVSPDKVVHGDLRFSYLMVKAQLRLYEDALAQTMADGCGPTWLQLLSPDMVPLSDCTSFHARLAGGPQLSYVDGGSCSEHIGAHLCALRQPSLYRVPPGHEYQWAPQWCTLLARDANILLAHEVENERIWYDPEGDRPFAGEVLDSSAADEHYIPNVLRDHGVQVQYSSLSWISPLDMKSLAVSGLSSGKLFDNMLGDGMGRTSIQSLIKSLAPSGQAALNSSGMTRGARRPGLQGVIKLFKPSDSTGSMVSLKSPYEIIKGYVKTSRTSMGHPTAIRCDNADDLHQFKYAKRDGYAFLRKARGNCTEVISPRWPRLKPPTGAQAPTVKPLPTFIQSVRANYPHKLSGLNSAVVNLRKSSDEQLMLSYFLEQPMRWFDSALGNDTCSVALLRTLVSLSEGDLIRMAQSLGVMDILLTADAEQTRLVQILSFNYTTPLDPVALLPKWGPEVACPAGYHRCSARISAPSSDAASSAAESPFRATMGRCMPSVCQGDGLARMFHILRRVLGRLAEVRLDPTATDIEADLALIRELKGEDRPLAKVEMACRSDLLPPNYASHLLFASTMVVMLLLAPKLLPTMRRQSSGAPHGSSTESSAALQFRFVNGVRILAIGTISFGHVFAMTTEKNFWVLLGDGSSLFDLLNNVMLLDAFSVFALQTFNFLSAFFVWRKLLHSADVFRYGSLKPYAAAYCMRLVRFIPSLLFVYFLFPRFLFYFETSSSFSFFTLSDYRSPSTCNAAGLARHLAILFFPYNMWFGEEYFKLCLPHLWFLAQDLNLFAIILALHWWWINRARSSPRSLFYACAALAGCAMCANITFGAIRDRSVYDFEALTVDVRKVRVALPVCMGGIVTAELQSLGISFDTVVIGSRTRRALTEVLMAVLMMAFFIAAPLGTQVLHWTSPARNMTAADVAGKSFAFRQRLAAYPGWRIGNHLVLSFLTSGGGEVPALLLLFLLCSKQGDTGPAAFVRRVLSLDVFALLAPSSFAIYMCHQLVFVLVMSHAYQQIAIPAFNDLQHVFAWIVWMLLMSALCGALIHHLIEEPWALIDWGRVSAKVVRSPAAVLPHHAAVQSKQQNVADSTKEGCVVRQAATSCKAAPESAFGRVKEEAEEEALHPRREREESRPATPLLLLVGCAAFILGRSFAPIYAMPPSAPTPPTTHSMESQHRKHSLLLSKRTGSVSRRRATNGTYFRDARMHQNTTQLNIRARVGDAHLGVRSALELH